MSQKFLSARTIGLDLAHVRHVEQTGGGAHRDVLLAHAVVLHRHVPSGERNHARRGAHVCVMEGSAPQRSGGGQGAKDPSNRITTLSETLKGARLQVFE